MSGRRPPIGSYDLATPVLILKTRSQPLHHGTVGVIRSLGRMGVQVFSSRDAGLAPAAMSRYLRDRAGLFSPIDAERNIVDLLAFQRRVGRPMVIVPVDDSGALFLAENAEALRPQFLLPQQKPDLPRTVASKANNPRLCLSAGAAAPESLILGSAEDLAAVQPAFGYPAVVKIAQPWLLPPGLLPAVLARSADDLADYRSRLKAASSADVVVQEYIPDELAEDWFYHGYHRQGGEPVVGFTGRKLRSFPPFLGATSYAVSCVNEEVLAVSQRMLRGLGYAGIVELEFRFDKRDRRYKFIDFNPRLGAQFQFLRNEHRIDVVRAMHLDLTGRRAPEGRQLEGGAFLSDFTDPRAFLAYWASGAVGVQEWLHQLLAAEDHSWFALDDLWPFAAAFGFSAVRFLASAIRRARGAGGLHSLGAFRPAADAAAPPWIAGPAPPRPAGEALAMAALVPARGARARTEDETAKAVASQAVPCRGEDIAQSH